jgi:hypothetical protein
VRLTRYEFHERCFYTIGEPFLVTQLALLVELFWNGRENDERWPFFVETCEACGVTAETITRVALQKLAQARS